MTPLSRRDFLKLSGLSLLSTAFFSFEPVSTIYQEQPIIYQGSAHYNHIALTYDDCYLVTMMQRLETILEQHPDVLITLFPVGEALLSNQGKDPGIWKRFYKKGHEIGYHSFDHTNPQVVSRLSRLKRWWQILTAGWMLYEKCFKKNQWCALHVRPLGTQAHPFCICAPNAEWCLPCGQLAGVGRLRVSSTTQYQKSGEVTSCYCIPARKIWKPQQMRCRNWQNAASNL